MAVAFSSTFYDTTPGAGVDEVNWSKGLPSIGSCEYGVKGSGDWQVTAVAGQPFTLAIAPGTGWGQGVIDTTADQDTISVDTLDSGTRWDFIGAKRDWKPAGGGPTQFTKIINAGGKQIPTSRKNSPGDEDDQPLALVQWTAGQTQPTAIVDLRCWAGNGGLEAADKLALTYLSRPGAAVKVGRTLWRFELGMNGAWVWTPYGGQFDIGQGSAQPIIKSDSLTVYSNSVGIGQISPIGGAFPTRMVSCVPSDADNGARTGAITVKYDSYLSSRSAIFLRFYDADGKALTSVDIAVSYVAIGY